ncbi:MAG TPA: PEP-CTERM sorting domain-containing protein [Bryobacteraceae bacterium]|nr:PEP-CTERM sorting domain-containing protein [Bryobacteraceae bacterium]
MTSAVASADTIVTLFGTLGDSTNATTLGSPGLESPQLHQFNAANAVITCAVGSTCSGPTLTSISFGLTADISGSLTFFNTNNSSQTVLVDETTGTVAGAKATILITDPNSVTVDRAIPTFAVTSNVTIGANSTVVRSGTGTATRAGTITFNGTSWDAVTGTITNNLTDTQVNNTYVGTGLVTFLLDLQGSATLPGTFPNQTGVSANSETLLNSSNFNITYNYAYTQTTPDSATPEPVSFALIGGGLIGVALLRKRAARK